MTHTIKHVPPILLAWFASAFISSLAVVPSYRTSSPWFSPNHKKQQSIDMDSKTSASSDPAAVDDRNNGDRI